MRRTFGRLIGMLQIAAITATAAVADFGDATQDLERHEGLTDMYLDHDGGRVLLALEKGEGENLGRFIYATYLTAGLGSNPMGLDRSVPSGSVILNFRRAGKKVMAIVENNRFTASADNPAERKAVETSFARSIIWSGDILEIDEEDGKVLLDITSLLMRDGVGVADRLKSRGQGSFSLAKDRSFVDTRAAFMFPINGEFDAHLTFAGSTPGSEVETTTPIPEAVTLIAHTTLRALPEPGYQARRYDERAALLDHAVIDMSAPLAGDVVTRVARRFRLEKDASGNVVNPIIFHIDNGAPEPIRSALQEGANWWATAFEAAGFPGGYRVEILPEGVHPLDARYNVVNWVHRATRGWSYGASLSDPRTGEILRGVVLLGSLRVRQDIKIFEALAGAGKTGTGDADDPVQIALQRIRQLAAHEVGHAIGFAHNMAASSYGGRASVMDYPAPDIRATEEGQLDFSNAYGVGVGAWDDWTVNFLYGDYGDQPDAAAQAAMVREADAAGMIYVPDGDSRSVGTGHAQGALWDNGEDPVVSLQETLEVRRLALSRFGEDNLRADEALSALQTKFVPLYLYHRYQLQAAAKVLGGMTYQYRRQGDGRAAAQDVPWERQQAALDALLGTLSPDALVIDERLVGLLSPLGYAYGDPQFGRETFPTSGRPMFDPMAAVASAAKLTFDALLHPARLQRLYVQGLKRKGYPGLDGVMQQVSRKVLAKAYKDPRQEAVRQLVVGLFAERLISLSLEGEVPVSVRQASRQSLMWLKDEVTRNRRGDQAFADGLTARIDDALARARTPAIKPPKAPGVPPGSPIGSTAETCWHCYP